MPHTYTKEIIFHFTCCQCKNWWSYAGTTSFKPQAMSCPFCSHLDATQEQNPIQPTTNDVPFQYNPSIRRFGAD